MTLRNLRVFIKVAECGKMSTVAKQLYVSQSSVSQSITEIEREYGVALFDRMGKQLHITPIGQELLEYARKAVAYQDSIDAWLSQCSQVRRLRAGASVTVGETVFSGILAQVKERGPGTEVTAFIGSTGAVAEKLLSSELDIALVEEEINDPYIATRAVMEDSMVLLCGRSHRLCGKEEVSLSELAGEALLLWEHGGSVQAQVLRALEEGGVVYRKGWESASTEAVKQGVMDGHGVAVISRRLAERELEDGSLWACRVKGLSLERHFFLANYKDRVKTDSMKLFASAAEELA